MGFRSDLQRWTEAQLRRLAQDGDLAHAIRRLIDYPHEAGDQTPLDRGLIPGGLGVALRQNRLEIQQAMLLYNAGLLGLRSQQDYPLSIYAGTGVQTYFAGAGSIIPGSQAAQYLVGAGAYGGESCGSGTSIVFPPTPPALDNDNAYFSTVYLDEQSASELEDERADGESTSLSSLFTGLLRLGVQAKVGAGRPINELCPAAWLALDGNAHGLVRDDDYLYWLIQITQDGVSAAALENGPLTECYRLELAAGTITDANDALRVESILISDLTSTVAPVDLLAQVDLESIYGGRMPLAYGWHYTHAAPWDAVIVTSREGLFATVSNWYAEQTLAHVGITITTGAPVAVVTIDEKDTRVCGHPFQPPWMAPLPDNYAVCAVVIPPVGHSAGDSDAKAPLYAFYKRGAGSDELVTLRYTRKYSGGSVPWSPIELELCGANDTDSGTASWSSSSSIGGFSLGSTDWTGRQYAESGSYSQETIILSQGSSGANTVCSSPSGWDCTGGSMSDWLDANVPEGGEWGCDYFTETQNPHEYVNAYRQKIKEDGDYSESESQFAIVPGFDAEACYLGRGTSTTRTGKRVVTQNSTSDDFCETRLNVRWRYPGENFNPIGWSPWFKRTTTQDTDWPGGSTSETTYPGDSTATSGEIVLITGTGPDAQSLDDDVIGHWSAALGVATDNLCPGWGMMVSAPFGGDGLIYERSPGARIIDGGYPSLHSLPSFLRWVGYA